MSITPSIIPRLLTEINHQIDQERPQITALDQAIGDGDHVVNLQRGLDALTAIEVELGQLDWSPALIKIGMSLMASMGGASGSLLGSLFLAMGKATSAEVLTLPLFADCFAQGVAAVKQRGKAQLGEKTMLDTLIPASQALSEAAKTNETLADTLSLLKQAAISGMQSTKEMAATKGRASYLGERARGHIDAGARTSQLIICAIADELLPPDTA